jgi:L,D-transpeptidase YbiS
VSRRARLAAALGAILGLALLVLWLRSGPPRVPPAPPDPKPLDAAGLRELGDLRGRARTLEERIAALAPKGTYVVIDTGRNLLTLVVDGKPSLTAVCSTGSGRALADPERRRFWVFDTPRGEHFVRRKYPQPVWIKPDWAFLEEGEPIPKSIAERLAPAELGAFAMDLGDGYLIHGTLYQRALGLSITHGCVRLGDHDLKMVYGAIKIGTPVYIF